MGKAAEGESELAGIWGEHRAPYRHVEKGLWPYCIPGFHWYPRESNIDVATFIGGTMKYHALAAVVCAALISGCSSTLQTASSESSTAPLAGGITGSQKADGFVDVGNGVAMRWANAQEKTSSHCPSYSVSCFHVAVQTNLACSGGVYVELQLMDSSETIIGKANEITPAMRAGDKGVFAVSTATKAAKAAFAKVDCLD